MALVKRNIFANFAGSAWIAALTLVITPLQVNILGMKAYGLVGFIATLQIVFSMLDLGLSATLTRELAADHSPGRIASGPLLRSASTIYYLVALVIGLALASAAGPIARDWFHADGAGFGELQQGLVTIAIYLALRWPVALYTGILTGLQRMDLLNAAKVAANTLRALGGIVVLLIWRRLDVFLWWTAASALAEVLIYMAACARAHPAMPWRPGLSWPALRPVWRDTLHMGLIAILGAVLPQLDRLVISRMLPIEQLGFYSLAFNTITATSLIIGAISTAMYPAFAAAHGGGDREGLLRRYDYANRIMLLLTGFVVLPLAVFGQPILSLWVNPVAAAGAWRPLTLLALGFWCNASVSNANSLAMACRQPGIPLRISLTTAPFYAAGLYLAIRAFGLTGAAGAWLALNGAYVLWLVPAVHRRVLNTSVAPWFWQILLPFVLAGGVSFLIPRLAFGACCAAWGPGSTFAALTIAMLSFGVLGYLLLGASLRREIHSFLHLARSNLSASALHAFSRLTLGRRAAAAPHEG